MAKESINETDRPSVRKHPPGWPIMYQSQKLLFLHWPLPAESLRPLIPDSLNIDTFDGAAWIGYRTTWTPGSLPLKVLFGSDDN